MDLQASDVTFLTRPPYKLGAAMTLLAEDMKLDEGCLKFVRQCAAMNEPATCDRILRAYRRWCKEQLNARQGHFGHGSSCFSAIVVSSLRWNVCKGVLPRLV